MTTGILKTHYKFLIQENRHPKPYEMNNFLHCSYNLGCIWSKCSSSSAERKRNAADSRYPVTNWRTAVISVLLSLWFNNAGFFVAPTVCPFKESGVEQPNKCKFDYVKALAIKDFLKDQFGH